MYCYKVIQEKLSQQRDFKKIITPNEFATSPDQTTARGMWSPKSGKNAKK